MAITIDQVEAELAQLRAIEGDVKSIAAILIEVAAAIRDDPPIWDKIDPTTAQRDAILAAYDTLKAALKTKVAGF